MRCVLSAAGWDGEKVDGTDIQHLNQGRDLVGLERALTVLNLPGGRLCPAIASIRHRLRNVFESDACAGPQSAHVGAELIVFQLSHSTSLPASATKTLF